jgi:hypothetical protein
LDVNKVFDRNQEKSLWNPNENWIDFYEFGELKYEYFFYRLQSILK